MSRFGKMNQTKTWLREGFHDQKQADVPEKRKMEETAALAVLSYRQAEERKRTLNFGGLILRQIRYTGYQAWLWQALLFLGMMTVYHCVFRPVGGEVDLFFYRRFPSFLCAAGLISAWSSVPFLFRSFRWKMSEVEAAARFSVLYLRAAQLLIMGGGAVLMMAGVAGAALVQSMAGIEDVALYLLFPFLTLGSCILHLLRKGEPERLLRNCSGAGAVLMLLFFGWEQIFRRIGYQPEGSAVWSLCGVMLLIGACQIWMWKKEEENRWNLA